MTQLMKIANFYGRFLLSFTAIGYWWRSLFWSRLKADLSGQTWLVTGASGGVGRAIVLGAAARGATVLAAARSAAKLDELVADASSAGGKDKVVPLVVDFSLKRDVRRFTEQVLKDHPRIDVLVNNVGVLLDDFSVTDEGHETSFATNILSHFMLTERLIEAGTLVRGGAVVNMSSGGMYNSPLAIGAMDAKKAEGFNGIRAYAVHKRGQAALTSYWSEVYAKSHGLTFYVMHPGWADTQGVKTSLPRFRRILAWVLRTPAQGADTAIWLGATRPQGTDPEGFWLDRATRPAHAYEFTMKSKPRPVDLANYLKGASTMPAP
jgi:dehydrogenase/reductase SDR family protein 12